jgi:hypothetical protein
VFSDEIGAGCVTGLRNGISISISEGRDPQAVATRGFEHAARVLIFGFASDRVSQVDAISEDGRLYSGRFGENAYLIELPSGASLRSVQITARDGSQTSLVP